MGKAVYFDMTAGCSGDMVLGALLDAGLELEKLASQLSSLPVTGYMIRQERVRRSAIMATHANVILESSVHQHARSYSEIDRMIRSSGLPAKIKQGALSIFKRLGEAEAGVHGVPLNDVHFHEVGAVDSIVDIVGAVIGFNLLGITDFYASPFPASSGYIKTSHGMLPLPAPATASVIATAGAPVVDTLLPSMRGFELVTPTGAAIVTTLARFERPPMLVSRIGYGAGSRDNKDYPNVLRLWTGEIQSPEHGTDLVLLETNIDDMNPQIYEYVMDKLFKCGALDVWMTPIQMKKNRPAVMLSVLSPSTCEQAAVEIIMRETTTLGIRTRPIFRHIAGRESREIKSAFGKVRIKIKQFEEEILSVSPEYEVCRRIAEKKGIPLKDVFRMIESEARRQLCPGE